MGGLPKLLLLAGGAAALENGLGRRPPLGWSTWNYFATDIDEALILETADSMVSTGLRDVGFEYVNIDAGYLLPRRDAETKKLQVDGKKFPRGMRFLADYLHNRSLKLGVYTDISRGACAPEPGSAGFYGIDAETFARDWDADYLKVDFCGPGVTRGREQIAAWQGMRDALNRTGKAVYYSICPQTPVPGNSTGTPRPYKGGNVYSPPVDWSAEERSATANSLLVEFENNFEMWYADTIPAGDGGPIGKPGGIITNIDAVVAMTKLEYSAPGSWNDADLLQICTFAEGKTRHPKYPMTMAEYRSHYAIWSVIASPLIHSADLRTVGQRHPDCLKLMLNREIVAVNQDEGGHPAWLVEQRSNGTEAQPSTKSIVSQTFARPLGLDGGARAVVLFNRGEEERQMSVTWQQLRLDPQQAMAVRDVMEHKDLGRASGSLSLGVSRHDVAFLTLRPAADAPALLV